MIPKIVMDVYIEMHQRDSSDAKFKIGQKVTYIGNLMEKGSIHTILAVNVQDVDLVEYAISDYGFLVYEVELKTVDPLSYCVKHNRPTDESCCCPECEEEIK